MLGAWHETTQAEECHEDRYRGIGFHVRDMDRRYLGLKSPQQEHAIGPRARFRGPVYNQLISLTIPFGAGSARARWDKNFPGRSNAAQTGDRDRRQGSPQPRLCLRVPLARWIAPCGLAWWRVGTAYPATRLSLSPLRRLLLDPLDPRMAMVGE